MEGLLGLLPIVGIGLLFWLLLIRPAAKRQREQAQMQSELEVGDRVITTSGFFGTLRRLQEDKVELEIAPGTNVMVARAAVAGVVNDLESPSSPDSGQLDSDNDSER